MTDRTLQEHRIYGPPGTGKTTEVMRQVTKAADFYGGNRVMVSSYTTAAAAEISSRVESIPEDNIGTLHKTCFEAIGKMPVVEEKKKSILEWNEFAPAYAMSLPGCKDVNSGLEYGDSVTQGDKLLGMTTVLRNKMIPKERWPETARKFIEAWTSYKNSVAGIDYTDMLEFAYQDIDRAPADPAIMFVDEAQDCTALQFAVLKKWARNCDKLIMVGDDDQCIYQFAGATPEAFAAHQVTDNDRVLEQSYRVPFAVWETALTWISKVSDRVEKDYLPKRGEVGFVSHCPYNFKMGEKLADLVIKSIERGKSVMAIGACSYTIEPLKMALIEQGIPFHNPYRLIRADWNPLRLATGTTFAQRVAAFYGPQLYDRPWWTSGEIKDFAGQLKADGVFHRGMKGKLDEITGVDIEVLFKYFKEDAVDRILHLDLEWWKNNLVNDEARRKANFPLKVVEKFGPAFLDAEETPPEVILGTIHSVKGGEADIVIIFPDLSQEGMQEWTGAGKSAIRRLMYVGMTRAKKGLIIAAPASSYCCDL